MGQVRTQFVPSHPHRGKRDRYQSQGEVHASSATQTAKEARVWVEVEGRAHRLGLQGPRDVSILSCNRLS